MNFRQIKAKLFQLAEKGYVTYDEINNLLGPEIVDTELYEAVMDMLQERGIKVVDSEEVASEERDDDPITVSNESLTTSSKDGDPVRLYLKDMGKIPLLKREEEIAYAKQIERGT
ncbi:MAG: sigma-70 factor domain-containing protein, partial [Aquificaceae bacterium]|nr:sigma-70 factor domain-containing protein [Aquificaceae bacterium]